MLESLPVDNPRTFQQMFPNASPEATDLVGSLLQLMQCLKSLHGILLMNVSAGEQHRWLPDVFQRPGTQVSKLLQFNPDKRITAEEALAHPYVAQFHNEADEPSHPTPITIPIDDNHKVLLLLVGQSSLVVLLL